MTELVAATEIEQIVGMLRHPTIHYGRADSASETVSILHSEQCVNSPVDRRDCPFSTCLDNGINPQHWVGYEDQPVQLTVVAGHLAPIMKPQGAS